MQTATLRRRRSDAPDFIQTTADVEIVADEIFSRYAGPQRLVIDGIASTATFFHEEYCPDRRVMVLAGRLTLAVNHHALLERDRSGGIQPLRVTLREIMLASLFHDLGKHHEDCAAFIQLLQRTDLRGGSGPDAGVRKAYLLGIVRDVHCRKGPCMIDRLRDAGRPELANPFVATVARRHGEDYQTNRSAEQGCWWSREINVVTIADDYDAMLSRGPERAYKPQPINADGAASMIRAGSATGRYEPRIAEIFITDVLGLSPNTH